MFLVILTNIEVGVKIGGFSHHQDIDDRGI